MEVRSTKTADLRIGIGEEAALQQRIVGEIQPRDNMARVERGLLVLGKEVIRVTVKHHFAHQLYRHQLFRNQLGRIQQVEVEFELILFRNELESKFIFRIVARFDGFPQLTAVEVRVAAGQFLRFVPYQRGFTRDRLPVEAHKGGFPLGVDQAEGVDTKTFHGAVATRDAAVGHRPHHVVQGLRLERNIIPEGIMRALALRNSPVRLGFYGVNKIGKLVCVLNKEDRGVVPDQIKNALVGIELSGEAANIAHRIGRAGATLYRGEANKYRRDFIRIGKEIGFSNLFQAFVRLEIAMGGGATRVYDALRDTLMVEMGDFLPQDEVFQQGRAAGAGAQGVLIVSDAHPLIGGQRIVFAVFTQAFQGVKFFVAGVRRLQAAWRSGLLSGGAGCCRRPVGAICGSQ